jgi:hypothetical protein
MMGRSRERGGGGGVVTGSFGIVLALVSLGENANINPLLLIKFCGLKHLFGGGSEVILEINFVHILKFPSD